MIPFLPNNVPIHNNNIKLTTTQQQSLERVRREQYYVKFVNAIGENKDVQFVGEDLRSLLTAPEIPLDVSSDAADLSPSEHCS